MGAFIRRLLSQLLDVKSLVTLMLTGVFGHMTAIGQVDANHYVIIVADGRRDGWSDKGMTLQELQQVFVEQGCKVAYNLDGGGSATMVLGDQRVNKTSGSRERDVSDIVYFTK